MKKLIVCFDGTWNNPNQEDNGVPAPTNVVKLHNAIAKKDNNDIDQLMYYHPGLGGEGGILKPITGGAFGIGITRHICSAYYWLATNYEEGDKIYMYGFSRGAFTVRSLAGFLKYGLLNLIDIQDKEAWKRVHKAFKSGYKQRNTKKQNWAKEDWNFFHNSNPLPIHFLGVWDTVGSLGIPDDLELLNILDPKDNWEFFDTKLGNHIQHARHAMALDEIRAGFTVTRWGEIPENVDAKEVWFPGVHSDIGGGYEHTDLSNGSLLWMMKESEKNGLRFRENIKNTIKTNPLGVLHNSYKGIFSKMRSRPRSIDAMIQKNKNLFHSSALKRQKNSPIEYPAYRETKILQINESITIDIFANTKWNYTSVYLEKGAKYIFSSKGEWKDSKDVCDWKGTENDELTFGDVTRFLGSIFGKSEKYFKKLTGNKNTDFMFTKRVENFDWFTMVGTITNDRGVNNDGSPNPHQYINLVNHEHNNPLSIDKGGYLYCFPNDVWSLYSNNHGSVKLTVKRIS